LPYYWQFKKLISAIIAGVHQMRIFTSIDQRDLQKIPALTKQLEAKGFNGIATFENRHDPFLPLAVAATNSTNL